MTIFATLCFLRRNGQILLIKKSRGFGKGNWNAPGGRILPDETPEQCADREIQEETGLNVSDVHYHGTLHFYAGGKEPDWTVYVFSTRSFSGDVKEGEEGSLKWFDEAKMPYREMWQDDAYWMPLLLGGRRFEGKFHFTKDWKTLVRHKLRAGGFRTK